MSIKKTIYFLLFFLVGTILNENKVFYISPSGSSTNIGTEDSPWNFDWSTISAKLRKDYTNSNNENSYTLYFCEGDYYVDRYGISLAKMDQGQYIRFYAKSGERVRIIGGKKLPAFRKHPNNERIWITEMEVTNSSYQLYVNNRRLDFARAPKSWNYDRLWDYYTTTDSDDSTYIYRHYVVSEELIKILSILSLKELNQARIV